MARGNIVEVKGLNVVMTCTLILIDSVGVYQITHVI